MKKDIQRLGLALIVGSLIVITGCEQKKPSNDQMMKGNNQQRSYGQNGNGQSQTQDSDSDAGNGGSCGGNSCNKGCGSSCN